PMNEKILAVILALSLLANLGMGLYIANDHLYGPGMLRKEYETDKGADRTIGPSGESGRTIPVADILDTISGQEKRSASLQGLAVITTINYSRQGQFIYQEKNETGTTINVTVDIIPGEGRVLVQ